MKSGQAGIGSGVLHISFRLLIFSLILHSLVSSSAFSRSLMLHSLCMKFHIVVHLLSFAKIPFFPVHVFFVFIFIFLVVCIRSKPNDKNDDDVGNKHDATFEP